MRKIFTVTLLSLHMLANADESTPQNSDFGNISAMLIILLFFLLIVIALLLICREAICWYFKINKIEAQQREILRLLQRGEEKRKGN